jgi:thioredoxin 1
MPTLTLDTPLVVCLCAQWCNVCEQYRAIFQQVRGNVQSDFPQALFVWMDIEDEADMLDPLDVENFPTLLMAVGDVPRFFGPITPQSQTLERLVRMNLQESVMAALPDPEVMALVGRIRAWLGSTNGLSA